VHSARKLHLSVAAPMIGESSKGLTHPGVGALLDGASVLISGATGFVGKVLLEKLLRCVPNVQTIYLLIRPKREISPQKRMFEEIVSSFIFSELQNQLGGPKPFMDYIKSKLVAISGDISYENCGISDENRRLLASKCSVVYHCAASIDFDERVDRAVESNVRGALRMYDLALSFDRCVSFVHVSTAYVNCNQPSGSKIEEKVYDLGFEPEEILAKVSQLSEVQLENFPASGMLRTWPNTYTFTKAITEHMLFRKFLATRSKVPLAICRPAIVTASWKEPIPGWVDDISAASAVYAGIAQGLLHFAPGRIYQVLDFIPVDFVVNVILLAGAAVACHPVILCTSICIVELIYCVQ
jgi:nucleoside-diphosphate-sugar epimerase